MPNSFGPFPGTRIRRIIQNAFVKAKWLTSRESISADILKNILHRRVPIMPDLGFFIRPQYSSKVKSIIQKWNGNEIIAITVRPWRFPGNSNPAKAYKKYINSIKNLIKWLISERLRPVIISHCLGPSAHEDDRNAIKYLEECIGQEDLEIVNTTVMNCEELAALYGAALITVGTRFHSVIFSLSQGTPSVAIGYGGNKAKGILTDIGQSKWHIPIDQSDGMLVVKAVQQLIDCESKVRMQLNDMVEEFNMKRDKMKKEIKQVILG
jgi:colanic acid/amylovoran biosynthesis protein